MTRFYGPCVGGPYDGKKLVEHRPHRHIIVEKINGKWRAVPAAVTRRTEWEYFGDYLFHPATESWHWFAPGEPVPAYDLWIKEPPVTSQIARDASR